MAELYLASDESSSPIVPGSLLFELEEEYMAHLSLPTQNVGDLKARTPQKLFRRQVCRVLQHPKTIKK